MSWDGGLDLTRRRALSTISHLVTFLHDFQQNEFLLKLNFFISEQKILEWILWTVVSLKVSISSSLDNRQCSSVTAERERIECAPGWRGDINIVDFYLQAPTEARLTFVLSINLQIWRFAWDFLGNKYDPLAKKQAGDSREQGASLWCAGDANALWWRPSSASNDRTYNRWNRQGCRAVQPFSPVDSFVLVFPSSLLLQVELVVAV